MALNILVRWVKGASPAFRGVGTWGAKSPPQSFQKTQKVPSLWWQSALCLCENCCSDCILYDCNYFSCPSSVANISGKDFSGALFIPKVPLETGAHQSFDASYAPASFTAWKIFTHFTDPIGSKGDHQQHYDFRLGC